MDDNPNLDREFSDLTRSPEFDQLEQYAGLKTGLGKTLWEHEERITALEAQLKVFLDVLERRAS